MLTRLSLVEEAVFRTKAYGGTGKTIFDDYTTKMTEMDSFLKTETKRLEHLQSELSQDIDQRIFGQDQKVGHVLQMASQIDNHSGEISKLKLEIERASQN